jgi:hypothetical protein
MIAKATKRCKGKHGCGRELPVSEFYIDKRHGSLGTCCKSCDARRAHAWKLRNPDRHAINNRAQRYGLTKSEVMTLLLIPVCQSCGSHFKSDSDRHFDHCHELGHVRGVICRACNIACSGTSKVAMDRLRSCVEYLKRDIEREQARAS